MEKFPHLLQSLKILHDRQYRKIINSKIQDKIRYKFIIQITITSPWKDCNKIFSSSWKRHRQSLIVLHNRDRTSSIVHYIVAYTAHDSPAKTKNKNKSVQLQKTNYKYIYLYRKTQTFWSCQVLCFRGQCNPRVCHRLLRKVSLEDRPSKFSWAQRSAFNTTYVKLLIW